MVRIVITAKVDDVPKWQANQGAHRGDLWRRATLKSPWAYAIGDENQIVLYGEAENLDKYMEVRAPPR